MEAAQTPHPVTTPPADWWETALIFAIAFVVALLSHYLIKRAFNAFGRRVEKNTGKPFAELNTETNSALRSAPLIKKFVYLTSVSVLIFIVIYGYRFVTDNKSYWNDIIAVFDYFHTPQPFEKPQLIGFAVIISVLVVSTLTYKFILSPLNEIAEGDGDSQQPPPFFLRAFTAASSALTVALAFLLPI